MGNLNLFIVYFFALVLAIFLFSSTFSEAAGTIGVNYGQTADNLPSPASVVQLLRSNGLNRVKIYDSDASVLRALAGSGIKVIVGLPNPQLASVAGDQKVANQWVERNVRAYYPSTDIIAIAVGTEDLSENLVPAMKNIHKALTDLQSAIKVSSPIAFYNVETISFRPSSGRFRGDIVQSVVRPMLEFLNQTGSYLMVNIYPFYSYAANPGSVNLDYALFRTNNSGVVDSGNGLSYLNLFDAEVDATYAAMSVLGYKDLKLVVTQSGWPSVGNETGAGVQNAAVYNGNLVKRILNGGGTPLKPNETLDVYIFALFNENRKGGATSERNFGLFYPNQQKVYPISFTRGN